LHGDIIGSTNPDSGKPVMVLICTVAGAPAELVTGRHRPFSPRG
jgi:hypothetical protein